MAELKKITDDLSLRPEVVDTNQDLPATIDYKLILFFLVVVLFLFNF